MRIRTAALTEADLGTARGLARDPSLATEFEQVVPAGALEDVFTDTFCHPALRRLGSVDGTPAGFMFGFVLPSPKGRWSMLRIGVLEQHRRAGLGSALLEDGLAALAALPPEERPRDACLSAWVPSATAAGFAGRHGFDPLRTFWKMERPLGGLADVRWPEGIEVRTVDGSEQSLRDWNDVYNSSFATHFRYVESDLEHVRSVTRQSSYRQEGVALAYRDGRCVGFCGDRLHGPERGEIATLGVVPEARGIGLGRALLRWGVRWLERQGVSRVDLRVDGENESALRLYRSEGFEVARTRQLWSRPLD